MSEEPEWQRCFLMFPRRTIDGGWTSPTLGQTYRRKVDGKWQYRWEPEDQTGFDNRQW